MSLRRLSSRLRRRRNALFERNECTARCKCSHCHYHVLNQYGNRCDWLKDDKFLKDLEGDSVDTEILDEELRSLQDDEPKTCRGKSVKWLESNPFQIVLCFLVLVDAGVVIAEILLDLHAIRGQYNEAHSNLLHVLDFVKDFHADELGGYKGNNVDRILSLLHNKYGGPDHNYTETDKPHVERHRRHVGWLHDTNSASQLDMLTLEALPSLAQALERLYLQQHDEIRHEKGTSTAHDDITSSSEPPAVSPEGRSSHLAVENLLTALGNNYLSTTIKLLEENIRLRSDIAKLYDGLTLSNQHVDDNRVLGVGVPLGGASVANRQRRDAEWPSSAKDANNDNDKVVKYSQKLRPTDESRKHGSKSLRVNVTRGGNDTALHDDERSDQLEGHQHSEAKRLHKIAHILHYCSIAILGIFVIQLLLKVYGMGIEFFKKRMEIFDAVIILASFALDLVFLEGIGGAKGEEAAALLIVFLLWRILRVINGIMITTKKRQEFRIKLQKRARRRAEKKIEILEEDRQLRDKEIGALKELCAHLGGKEDEIAACKPRRKSKGILSRLDTSMGLTSVASLSLSLSMSMSGGVLNMARANPMINRRDSLQENLPPRMRGPGISRPSTMGNNVRDTSPLPRGIGIKTSMEAVIEESPLEDESKKANGAMVTGDTLALPPAQSTSSAVVTNNNTSVEDKPPPDGTPVSVQTIVHEENEISPTSKTPPRSSSRTSLGRVSPPSTGGTPPRTSPSTPPLGSPHGSWMHLGPLEGTSSLGGSAVLSPKSGTLPREGSQHSPGTPPRRFSGVGTPVSLSPATPPSPGPPMMIRLSKSPRQDRRRPPPVPPKPKKLKGILKRSEDNGRGRSPSPAPSPVFDDYDHDKATSPLLRERARTPSPRMRRRSRTPSPRMDRKATKEKEKDKRGKVLSKGKGKRRGDRPRSSVQLEFENELATPGQPPRRARSSETIVVANGPMVRGLSPSLSALRSSREDVMVRLQGRGQMSPGDSRVQTTKL